MWNQANKKINIDVAGNSDAGGDDKLNFFFMWTYIDVCCRVDIGFSQDCAVDSSSASSVNYQNYPYSILVMSQIMVLINNLTC